MVSSGPRIEVPTNDLDFTDEAQLNKIEGLVIFVNFELTTRNWNSSKG